MKLAHHITIFYKVFLCVTTFFPSMSFAQTERQKELAKTVQIADVHMHLEGGNNPTFYAHQMAMANVRWAGAVGGGPRDNPIHVKSVLGGRYIAALGQNEFFRVLFSSGQNALSDLNNPIFQSFFPYAEKEFRTGRVRGFGEIHVNNISPFSPSRGQRKIPLENPVVLKMFEIANRHNGFVQIHTMMNSGSDEIIRVARRYSRTKVILSHCLPGASPAQVEKVLRASSNIFCELSAQGPAHGIRRVYSEAGLKNRWKILIERNSSRFMIGTDPCCGQFFKYQQIIKEIRTYLLPYLTERTMKKVAYQNAVRIFRLQ
jgi:hypothetical protein